MNRHDGSPGPMSIVVDRLIPGGVRVVEADVPWFGVSSAGLLSAARELRAAQYVLGRKCAAEALRQLGGTGVRIGSGPNGQPTWPPGIVGSITHCRGYCAAAAARSGSVSAIGIDAEAIRALSGGAIRRVCGNDELRRLPQGLAAQGPIAIFSAKESIYKAIFAATGRKLSYFDVSVAFDSTHETFKCEPAEAETVSRGIVLSQLLGSFALIDEMVFTAVAAGSGLCR